MRTIFIILLSVLFAGCRTTHPSIGGKTASDSLSSVVLKHDSIYIRDSIYIATQGDTVYQKEYKYIYRDRLVRDTFYHHHSDTIKEIVEVERQLTFWQRKKMELGGAVVWIAPLIAAIMVAKWKFL